MPTAIKVVLILQVVLGLASWVAFGLAAWPFLSAGWRLIPATLHRNGRWPEIGRDLPTDTDEMRRDKEIARKAGRRAVVVFLCALLVNGVLAGVFAAVAISSAR